MNRISRILIPIAFTLIVAVPSWADTFNVFSDRNLFNAAIAPAPANFFNSFPAGTIIPNGSTQSGVTFSLSDTTANFRAGIEGLSINGNGLDKIVGSTGNALFPADVITFTFASPIDAFGISFNAFGNTHGVFSLTTNSGNVALSSFDPFFIGSTGHFAGFTTDAPVNSVTVRETAGNNFAFGLNDLKFVTAPTAAVPEPSTLVLLFIGILLLLGFSGVVSPRQGAPNH